jgi:ABC-2 type transport system ATP-binding protein
MAADDKAAIEVRGLAKRFGEVQAVAGIDFDVREGEIFGFLGPNGAGKTTTINMLTGLARSDSGQIRYFGRDYTADVKKAQHLMGIVPDDSNLWPELDGFDNLAFCGALYGMARREREDRARELLDAFGLADAAKRLFGGYSKGMKRKLAMAAGIIHRPRILFLDEPTTGIDVASARQIRQLLAGLRESGMTVFLTTHYIEEAERLCDRIAFIVEGRLVRVDTLANLIRDVEDKHIVQLALSRDPGELLEPMGKAFPGVEFESMPGNMLRAHTAKTLSLGPLVRFLEDRGADVTEARVIRPSLEDVFVRITGVAAERMHKEKEQGKPKGGDA